MNQRRAPRGVPTGGQFEGNDHDEASHWLSDSPAPPEPTAPDTTSAIRRDGTAALMLPGSGRKIVLDLGASPYCESSGIYSASTNSVRLRYGVEAEKIAHGAPVKEVRSINDVQDRVSEMLAGGAPKESIYVAVKAHNHNYLVRHDEALPDTFDGGGYVIESDSPDSALATLRDYREWTDRRHFDVYERTVQMDGSMSEPEIVVEHADSNSAMKRAFFRDDG